MSADTGISTTTQRAARRALGAFIRLMRERTEPGRSARAARRRVRGMRREEVAEAAGISVTWYTWLEQGRDVRVSRRTIDAIARALRLPPTERGHLLRLAQAADGASQRPGATAQASESLQRLVHSFDPHPAYAVNAYWDVIAFNRAAAAVFGDFEAEPGRTDNVLRRLLLDAEWRERFEDRDSVTAFAIAQFRASTARLAADPAWRAFVDDLRTRSDEFRAHWDEHALASAATYTKVVRHPTAGRLPLLYSSLAPAGEPADVRLTIYTPLDAETAERVRALVRP